MANRWSSIKRLWNYLRPYLLLEVFTLLSVLAVAALAIAFPVAIRYMIDELIPRLIQTAAADPDIKPAVMFGLLLASIYVFNVIFGLLRDYLAARIGANIVKDMRSELFAKMQHVPINFYHNHQVGEIMSRLMSDVSRVQNLLTNTFLMFITNAVMLLGILIYLLTLDWRLTVVALIPVPVTIIFSQKFGNLLHVLTRKVQEATAAMSGRLQEALTGTRTIRAFGRADDERKRFDKIQTHLTGLYVKSSVTNSISANLIHFVNMLGPVTVLAWGTYLIAGGNIKLGALMAFFILLTYLYQPVQDLASVNVEFHSAMASVNRIFEYLDVPPDIIDHPNPVIPNTVTGNLRFQNVKYTFGENGFAINIPELEVASGEKVAIVGTSGAGKTTLINLIMRFIDPAEGEIMLDDIDIRRIPVEVLRKQIGLVDQEPVLFNMSIYENIAYSDVDAHMGRVREAARIANIHNFIESLADGYNNIVGERGVTLSGGERQRLCLARAILRDPAIYILDEATSAIDSQSEHLIQQALGRVLENKTAIMIAHRLSTVRHADRILVMVDGKIVDQGTHDSLLSSSAFYKDLAEKQLIL